MAAPRQRCPPDNRSRPSRRREHQPLRARHRATDIFSKRVDGAKLEIRRGGGDWTQLTADEARRGIAMKQGDTATVRATERHAWPVVQELRATADAVEKAAPNDDNAWLHMYGSAEDRRYTLRMKLAMFRDAWPDCKAAGWTPVSDFQHHLFVFSDEAHVPSESSPGWKRFSGSLEENQQSMPAGEMWFLEAPATAGVPQIVAVFAPSALNRNRPAHIHTFFLPKTEKKEAKNYPFGTYFRDTFDNYLVGGEKRVLNQHVASKKNALLVFPMPPPVAYFKGIDTGKGLRRYLTEIVAFLPNRLLIAELKHCVVSGFSAAGTPMAELMKTSKKREFPELEELYALDCIINKVTEMGIHADAWLSAPGQKKERKLRFYVAMGDNVKSAIRPSFVSGSPRTNDTAKDWSTKRTTWFLAPLSFWETLHEEQKGQTPNPRYFPEKIHDNEKGLHQLVPLVMLTHGLVNSGLE